MTRDYVVAREVDVDIRYEPATDRVFLIDTFTGELMVLKAETLEDALDTIGTLRKSAL
jgi:hypothetical protein